MELWRKKERKRVLGTLCSMRDDRFVTQLPIIYRAETRCFAAGGRGDPGSRSYL